MMERYSILTSKIERKFDEIKKEWMKNRLSEEEWENATVRPSELKGMAKVWKKQLTSNNVNTINQVD